MRITRWLSPAGLITSWALVALTVVIAAPVAAVANDDLGLSVTIVSTTNEEGLTEGNDSLWFGVEPGEEVTRVIEIESASEIDQAVAVELFDFGFENGERFTDFSEESVVTDWFGLSGEQLLLPAGEKIEVELNFKIPDGAEQISYEGTARVVATAAEAIEDGNEEGGFRALVGGRAAIDIPFWLGIGDAVSFVPEFNIQSIQGVLIEQTKYLRVFIENTGTIPLRLEGSTQFADPVFVERVFDPFVFRVPQIGIDSSGYVDVEIDQAITEGRWDVLVAANQGPIRQSKLFEQNITFIEPGSGLNLGALALQVIAFIGFLALAIVGYRLIRTPAKEATPQAKGRKLSPIAKGLFALAQAIEPKAPSGSDKKDERPVKSQKEAVEIKPTSPSKSAPKPKTSSKANTAKATKAQSTKKPAPAKKPATRTKAAASAASSKKPAAKTKAASSASGSKKPATKTFETKKSGAPAKSSAKPPVPIKKTNSTNSSSKKVKEKS